MSDDRIIDFNDLKNKVKDSDVDKFEQYIYNLYFSVMDGSMTMAEFSRKIFDYMKDNNISQNECHFQFSREIYEYTKKIHGKIWYGFGGSRKAT